MKIQICAAVLALAGLTFAVPVQDSLETVSVPHVLSRRTECENYDLCSAGDAQAVINDMIDRTTLDYEVGHDWSQLDQKGSCIIWGMNQGSGDYTSSYARDIGHGAETVYNTCVSGNGVAGFNTAGGNGNFLLYLSTGSPTHP